MRRLALIVLVSTSACGAPELLPHTAVPTVDRDHPPATLSALGLYADPTAKTVSSDFEAFDPEFVLWADGAEKKRWIRLPEGAHVDERDPDHWRFPVGTQI